MKTKKIPAALLSFWVLFASPALALTPVEDSAEDLFWTEPMTVHDYKKDTDLHNIAVSAMAFTELEFVRLGDDFIGLIARNKKSPISNSLDSLEYAYSRLPRVEPVRRFGQFWDALQLRQLSLSDARLLAALLVGDTMGGITPIMQVRVYKLVVLVEDVIYDLDRTLMSPFNWGVSSITERPAQIRLLGYAADGLGYLRWKASAGLKVVNREIVRVSSKAITVLEKSQDVYVRHKRRKQNAQVQIYSKMPLSVFLEHRRFFQRKKNAVVVGTPEDWRDRIYRAPSLPDHIRPKDLSTENLSALDGSREVIVSCHFAGWEKAPRDLKKYVITPDELDALMGPQDTSLSAEAV